MIGIDEVLPITGRQMLPLGVELEGGSEEPVKVSLYHNRRNLSQKKQRPVEIDNIAAYRIGFPTHQDILQVQIPMIDTLSVQSAKGDRHRVKDFFSPGLANKTVAYSCPKILAAV
jgi:hypothetical protein